MPARSLPLPKRQRPPRPKPPLLPKSLPRQPRSPQNQSRLRRSLPLPNPVTISTYNYAKEEVEVTFEKCPQRVVCTNQTQTELLLYFGLDEYIVGTAYLDGEIRDDLKPQYEALKAAGKELTVKGYPAKETVLALEPDPTSSSAGAALLPRTNWETCPSGIRWAWAP